MIFFHLIKERNRIRKEINTLLSKGIPSIYKKVITQTGILKVKKVQSPGQFCGSFNSHRYNRILKLHVTT